ncbi:glycerophosphodiester phosphodiesterase [Mycetocola zhadangensis]|uniref:glycerophosphodiester phosphodiesterase n=1 Tax=Mycetocola zhadangensis TaxID=1164595 RepID=UPI003A4D2340
MLLSGCASGGSQPVGPARITQEVPETVTTVSELLGLAPFYVAHRGSGDNWPEHTALAYRNAVNAGAQAIEISVNATSDGVLVCHHDSNTLRLTGVDCEIAQVTWDELSLLSNDATAWLGPRTPVEPIPRLKDVLDELAGETIIFVEDKQGTNTASLLDLLGSYPDATERFVWKQWAGGRQHEVAREHGYQTWGYFGPEDEVTLERTKGFDILGVHHSASDQAIKKVVSHGKPVIAWEVHYRSGRDRLSELGVVGMMCSNIPYVTARTKASVSDSFASGTRAAGDLPWTVDLGWQAQPRLIPEIGAVRLGHSDVQSYLMGSLAPIDKTNYEISFKIRWPDALPEREQHAGLAFGIDDDSSYRVGSPAQVGGYIAVLRADGVLELCTHSLGQDELTVLASVQTPVPLVGEWIDLVVSVDELRVAVTRSRNTAWEASVNSDDYRGGYFWLCKNYAAPAAVEYSSILVE